MADVTRNWGAQLSVELTNVEPVRHLIKHSYEAFLNYARDLRKSGSDMVVEADLVTIFGRGRVSFELEQKFREAVKIQDFVPLYEGSKVRLDSGAGPTVQHALTDRAYLATVIQLSMLAYFHNRTQLALMISKAISKRFEHRLPDAVPDPRYDGISKTFEAISSQTCAFAWHLFSQEVESRPRSSIPDYEYCPTHSRLSPNVVLGALDFFYIIQSLPENRRVSLSTQTGCTPIIIWAHYILQLTVVIRVRTSDDVFFGDSRDPHVYISWTEGPSARENSLERESVGANDEIEEASIRLHEKDMAVILEHLPEDDRLLEISAEERHPVQGYGTVFLRRMLNGDIITLESEPVYEDSVKWIIAKTIHQSKHVFWRVEIDPFRKAFFPRKFRQTLNIENWRIIKAGRMLFEGLPFNVQGIRSYVDFLDENSVDENSVNENSVNENSVNENSVDENSVNENSVDENSMDENSMDENSMDENWLPKSLSSLTKSAVKLSVGNSWRGRLMKQLRFMEEVTFAFSCVVDIDKCSTMPIVLHHQRLGSCFNAFERNPPPKIGSVLETWDPYFAVLGLLSASGRQDRLT